MFGGDSAYPYTMPETPRHPDQRYGSLRLANRMLNKD